MSTPSHTIRFALTRDHVRLAWAVSGEGPALVKAAHWLTHLEYDRESLVWAHWESFLSGHFSYYRYDERGIGLSDHQVEDFSTDTWLPDLETVTRAARPEKPFVLLGISQGAVAAMAYAAKYPENVSHLIIYGGYVQGWALRSPEEKRRREAICELVELGWGQSNPVFRRVYTSMFLPEGTEEQLNWFDEVCARSTSPQMAAKIMLQQGSADARHLPEQITVPTLVLHCREDGVVPCSQGMKLAAGISGSEFVQLDSRNHILLSHEPAWTRFKEKVLEFTGRPSGAEDPVFGTLSPRERDVLSAISDGMSNADIAAQLFISEKTVKNHITRIFEKLGVRTRSQAIVKTRDGGFS